MKTLTERFEEKYICDIKTGCWKWIAYIGTQGYGEMFVDGRKEKAHRISYQLYKGKIPDHDSQHGMCVCHSCDNRLCVNPYHLFLGTQKDNLKDMRDKNRQNYTKLKNSKHQRAQGSINGNSKFSESDILKIRESNKSPLVLAREYNVNKTTIYAILNRKTWKHI